MSAPASTVSVPAAPPLRRPGLEPEEVVEPSPTVFVIGTGAVGTVLSARLTRAGVPVVGLHGRRPEQAARAGGIAGVLATSGALPAALSSCDVLVLAVRDAAIAELVGTLVDEKRLRPGQVVLQTSGSRPAADLLIAARGRVAGLGTLHPLVSLATARGEGGLDGVAFGVEGEPAARRRARQLVRLLGGRPLDLRPESMALYHAGAVMASNYVVALAEVARALLVAAGIPEGEAGPALWPLMESTVGNLRAVGLPRALTGPVARGDAGSVERHLEAVAAHLPATLDLYQRLGREALALARRREPGLDEQDAQRLAVLLR